jgi:hypothetical protein
MSANGHGVMAIMREAGVSKTTVWRRQEYFVEASVECLVKNRREDRERGPADATHGSVRTMAEEIGVSHTSVQRIWPEHGHNPHQLKSLKVSNDPDFVKKARTS